MQMVERVRVAKSARVHRTSSQLEATASFFTVALLCHVLFGIFVVAVDCFVLSYSVLSTI